MHHAILIAMNVAVVVVLAGMVYFLNWSGPGFAAGILVGGISLGLYLRGKLGYWP